MIRWTKFYEGCVYSVFNPSEFFWKFGRRKKSENRTGPIAKSLKHFDQGQQDFDVNFSTFEYR